MTESQSPQLPRVSRKKGSEANKPQKTLKSLSLLGLLLLGVFLVIFWGMGWMAGDTSTSQELLMRLNDGSRQSERIAALSWNQKLQEATLRNKPEILKKYTPDSSQADRLIVILNKKFNQNYERSSADEVMTLGAVLQILSYSQDTQKALKAYADLVQDPRFVSLNPTLKTQFLLAMSRLAEKQDLELPSALKDRLLGDLNSDDADVRMLAAYAVGVWRVSEGKEALKAMVMDISEDVRWNAAFALGRWGYDEEIKGVFEELMDIAHRVQQNGEISEEKGRVLTEPLLLSLQQGMNLLVKFRSEGDYPELDDLYEHLVQLSRKHDHVKIRLAALEALRVSR